MSDESINEMIKENLRLKSEVGHLKSSIEHKEWVIRKLKYQIYGPQSEKVIVDEPEQFIFNELEGEALKAEPEQTELIAGYERKKGRGAKKPYPEDLEREEVEIDIPENEKQCPKDGALLKEIGYEITEKLKCYPARTVVLLEKKKKYACPCCHEHLVEAKANSILPKTIATPELLAFLIFSKFFQGLPLYRLEELFKLQGIELSRTRMASWLIRVAEKLQPIWNILEDWVLETGYVAIDATHVQVLKEPNRAPQTKSFMWARGSPERGIVLFEYDVSGGGEVAKRLMQDFTGTLQGDAHRGYNAIERKNIHLMGCMMHARRRFHDAWLAAKKQPGLAENALKMFKRLYKFEEAFKLQGLRPNERFEARAQEVRPYLEKIKLWCIERKDKVLKQSPLGNAIHYFINEYDELVGFLKDGRYEIDNGWIERAIRKFAIGRNNWLFCDTVEGANASSLLYSLVITAKLNEKDPFEVLTRVFQQLPIADSADDFEKLAKLFVKSE
jgi:transposase